MAVRIARLPTPSGTDSLGRPAAPRRAEDCGPVLAPARDAELFYRFSLHAPWGHVALVALLFGILWFLAPKIWRRYSAERLAANLNFRDVRQAIALEPARAEFRNRLGGLYLDSP